MQRRKFSREFKLGAVRMVRERGVTIAQASRDLAGGMDVRGAQKLLAVFRKAASMHG